jgi:hypothetical protein
MKKLAIYYGWPSLVRDSNTEKSGSLDEAIQRFLQFDIVILGGGLESHDHPEHSKSRQIIKALHENKKEAYGYIHLADSHHFQCFSEEELEYKLVKWKEMEMNGVLCDLINPVYHASADRVERVVNFAHSIGLGIIYNTSFDSNWLEERVIPYAKANDRILVEPFGTSWKRSSYPNHKKMPPDLRKLRSKGIEIAAVSTYNSSQISTATKNEQDALAGIFREYRKKAEAIGFSAYQFTNGEYSSSGKDESVLLDFNSMFI